MLSKGRRGTRPRFRTGLTAFLTVFGSSRSLMSMKFGNCGLECSQSTRRILLPWGRALIDAPRCCRHLRTSLTMHKRPELNQPCFLSDTIPVHLNQSLLNPLQRSTTAAANKINAFDIESLAVQYKQTFRYKY